MDRIELRGMAFQGRHGARDAERRRTQEFKVDVDVDADLGAASESDQLGDTIDYTLVRAAARDVIEGRPQRLLESLAGDIARRILAMPGVEAVSVRVAKQPASMRPLDTAAVRINRTRA
jgi:7,8-dihydroneopterin aldolase/epimerase/oxygenase